VSDQIPDRPMNHTHVRQGRDDWLRPDGILEVWWKCFCGLEEKRFFQDNECIEVRFRLHGLWAPARDWLTMNFPMSLCPECEDGIGCEACDFLGVVELDGAKIVMPPPPRPERIVP